MPVPTTLSDLSTTAGSNFPAGSNSPADLDDTQRAHASFIAQLRDGSHVPSATAKTTPVDADLIPINDSAASNIIKKVTWANFKATLKTYFDTIYAATGVFAAAGANTDIQSLGNNTSTIYTTAGTSTAYTITPNPVIAAYAIGQSFMVNFNAASGASPTLQISGIATPPNLVKLNVDGTFSNISANEIQANHRSRVTLISTTQALVEDTNPVVSMVRLDTQGAGASGNGTTNTKIPRWTTVRTNTGGDVTYADSATLGHTLTIVTQGKYSISFTHSAGGSEGFGITLNESAGTLNSNIASVAQSEILAIADTPGVGAAAVASWSGYLPAGSVIRGHTSGGIATAPRSMFTICRG